MKLLILPFSFALMGSVNAAMLVCDSDRVGETNHRIIKVNCSDKKAVIDALESSWTAIRQVRKGVVEDMCFEAVQEARALARDPKSNNPDLYPAFAFKNRSGTFFKKCNLGLMRHVK